MKIKIAILASGSGSNAENIMNYFRDSSIIEIGLIMSDKREAYVLERAKNNYIPFEVFSKQDMETTSSVLNILVDYKIDFIVLAGFLLRIPKNILNAFSGHIINIHPALLPAYGGKGMYGDRVHKAIIAAGEKESGITIHYINEHYDEGDIIFQAKCPVYSSDSPDDLAKKVHELEYEHFPKVIEKTIRKNFNL